MLDVRGQMNGDSLCAMATNGSHDVAGRVPEGNSKKGRTSASLDRGKTHHILTVDVSDSTWSVIHFLKTDESSHNSSLAAIIIAFAA